MEDTIEMKAKANHIVKQNCQQSAKAVIFLLTKCRNEAPVICGSVIILG